MFRFQAPLFFLFLVPLVVLVIQRELVRRPRGVLFSNVALIKHLPKTTIQRIRTALPWTFYLGVLLLVVALARPQTGKEEYRIRTEGIAIAMCVDRSGSMAAKDFSLDGQSVTRLDVVKKTFRDFVLGNGTLQGRPDDLIGLLAFGGYVDAFCPLTFDHTTLMTMLDQVKLIEPVTDEKGRVLDQQLYQEENLTAIGDALAHAVDRMKDVEAKSKVIILLSDGEQTFGTLTPLEGAEIAKAFGVKIYVIGIGSTGRVPFDRTDRFGRTVQLYQTMVLDEQALQEIAATTGGQYFNAKNTAALERVYAEIDRLEKTVNEGRKYTQYTELYLYALLPGFFLILLCVVLQATRFRRLP